MASSVNASSEYCAICNSLLNRLTSSFTVTLSLEIALVIIAGFEDKILKLIVGSSRSVFPHLVHWDFKRFTLVGFLQFRWAVNLVTLNKSENAVGNIIVLSLRERIQSGS